MTLGTRVVQVPESSHVNRYVTACFICVNIFKNHTMEQRNESILAHEPVSFKNPPVEPLLRASFVRQVVLSVSRCLLSSQCFYF